MSTKLGVSHGWDYKRVESLSADQQLLSGDAGKIFMVVQNATAALDIQLPLIATIQPGWKAKFILKTASSKNVVISVADDDGDLMFGMICSADSSGGESADTAVDELTFIASKAAPGDWAEIEFDGDYFYANGMEHDNDHMTIA